MTDADRRSEIAHGGLASRSGDMVTLGDGSRWWLNGQPWARNEADALIIYDRPLVARTSREVSR